MAITYEQLRDSTYWHLICQASEELLTLLKLPSDYSRKPAKLPTGYVLRYLYECYTTLGKPPKLSRPDPAHWDRLCRKRLQAYATETTLDERRMLGMTTRTSRRKKEKAAAAQALLDQPAPRSLHVNSYESGKQLPIFHPPFNELKLFP